MNTNKLKTYAQTARREFIEAVTERAHYYGLKENSIVPCEVKGDFTIINGCAFPRRVDEQRRALEEQVNRKGFSQVIEEVAYTWFNRFAAIRYMELHGFLSHGYRVLSHPEGSSIPEILEKAQHVELTGLDKEEVIKLKMDGTKDGELYSKLIIAECNELSKAMPFLFEHVQDYTELLLPDNLLHSDSIIRRLVNEICEEDWQAVEIIGWLYQYYISEKQDEVIGNIVKSEDIPAATQLFTPNWIVKYMVQNSLGAQWLATYPHSTLAGQMEYYIEPAEQTDEVKAQLAAITPSTLNPEELTLIDPASGSGHILVEAYELFKAIYLERGYRQRDVAQLILEKNLFGLDIDERAVQLTGFALMMKGRVDDRRLFERGVKLNVVSFQDSTGFDTEQLAMEVKLMDYDLKPRNLTELMRLFEHATTFGSLIQVPEELAKKLPALKQLSKATNSDLFVSDALKRLGKLVHQAELLATQYNTVAANPPYMGIGGMNCQVKEFAKGHFPDAKSDLFACFIERGYTLASSVGRISMVTMQSWMFLSSFQKLREQMLRERTISTMVQIGYNSFPSLNSKIAQATVFCLVNKWISEFAGTFINLNNAPQSANKQEVFLSKKSLDRFIVSADALKAIPGSPVAYWMSDSVRLIFKRSHRLDSFADCKDGLTSGNNDRFIRRWSDIDFRKIGFRNKTAEEAKNTFKKWFPYNKGGGFRKHYGNGEWVINWESDGAEIKNFERSVIRNSKYYFREGVTWTLFGIYFGARYIPPGFIFDTNGKSLFPNTCSYSCDLNLSFICSKVVGELLRAINPTLAFQVGDLAKLPILDLNEVTKTACAKIEEQAIAIARTDWDAYELSWDFQLLPILTTSSEPTSTLESSYASLIIQNRDIIAKMKRLEEENNRLFIEAYGLQDELISDVPIEQITLTINPAYRYNSKFTEEEQWTRFRQNTMEELVSYAIGCMMGRYSLDQDGLVYAHAGNEGFDHDKYKTFPADDDGIVPITDHEWFDDDAACRFFRFIETAWNKDVLEDNLEFVADAISKKTNESSRDSIRLYFVSGFFKDHLKTYKKRPIYWMFTSGKEKAFQALVYLHRYNEGTLSRMRTEYVLPLQSKITTHMEHLEKDKDHASSTSAANKIQKEVGRLRKQKEELLKFDENLHHYADKKISLDLDDGVKVNYGKFGDLLAEVKAVTGKK